MSKPLLLARPLTATERDGLEAGLRSPDAFTLRRSQIILASARGRPPAEIAEFVGCCPQAVRNAIWAFQGEGIRSLTAKSKGPIHPVGVWQKARDDELDRKSTRLNSSH